MLDSDRRQLVRRSLQRLGTVDADLISLIDRLKAMRGGYPSGGMNGGGGRGGVADTQPERMQGKADPTEVTLRRVDVLVERIHGDTAELANIRASTMPRPGKPGLSTEGCRSCARIGHWSAVDRSERCRWCYDFAALHGQDPPTRLLELRAQGRKITTRMVEEAMREPRPKPDRHLRRVARR